MKIELYPSDNATEMIQNAIDKLNQNGGGMIILNDGEYFLKSILLKSNVTIYLKSNVLVKASRNVDDYDITAILSCPIGVDYSDISKNPLEYLGRDRLVVCDSTNPFSRWSRAVIKAYRAENIAVIGEKGSIFDGCNCYDPLGEENFRGPHFINFHECNGVTLKGYTLENSSNWGHALFTSCNILCEDLMVKAGHDSIDVLSCDNVIIRNCTLQSGDDCVAGFDSNDVLVENCDLRSSCDALRIGGHNWTVKKCYIHGPSLYGHRNTMSLEDKMAGKVAYASNSRVNMLTAFEYYCDFRYKIRKSVDVVLEDCIVENCDVLLSNLYSLPEHLWAKNAPMNTLTLKNVQVKNVGQICRLYATKDMPMELKFDNCDLGGPDFNDGITENTKIIII